MQVIVHAESNSRGDGYYTRENIDDALDTFFDGKSEYFVDSDGEEEMTKEDAKMIFARERQVAFFDEGGEKIIISVNWSNK
jgi:hypothetical protein